MKHIDWHAAMREDSERLSFLYHLRSANTSYSPLLQRARMKTLKGLFQRGGPELTAGKHYYSAPAYRLEEAERLFGPAVRALLHTLEQRCGGESAEFGDYIAVSSELGVSAGLLHSISFYYLAAGYPDAAGAIPLLYASPDGGRLERVKSCEKLEWSRLFDAGFCKLLNKEKGRVSGIIFGAANLFRSCQLFGERGYRLSLIEAGRWAECLTREMKASTDRMTIVPADAFVDHEVNGLLDLDGIAEAVLISFVLWEEDHYV